MHALQRCNLPPGLLASLLEACSSDARFSHLKDRPYIVDDRNAYSVITPDMAQYIWSLPAVQLLVDIIDTVYKQKLTANESAAALFLPPDITNSIQQHTRTRLHQRSGLSTMPSSQPLKRF